MKKFKVLFWASSKSQIRIFGSPRVAVWVRFTSKKELQANGVIAAVNEASMRDNPGILVFECR